LAKLVYQTCSLSFLNKMMRFDQNHKGKMKALCHCVWWHWYVWHGSSPPLHVEKQKKTKQSG
jgi:hypothetical protein